MKRSAIALLRKFSRAGELPMSQMPDLVERRRNDHTDYYVLAGLINSGYLTTTMNYTPPEQFNSPKTGGWQ
jgi:hypothetical protein